MIDKLVQVTNVKTLADGTIRVSIDLLNGTSADIASVFDLMAQDTRMILADTETFSTSENEETHEDIS